VDALRFQFSSAAYVIVVIGIAPVDNDVVTFEQWVPTVGEQDTADIQKQRRDWGRSFHLISARRTPREIRRVRRSFLIWRFREVTTSIGRRP
jgi:hypothetical protein